MIVENQEDGSVKVWLGYNAEAYERSRGEWADCTREAPPPTFTLDCEDRNALIFALLQGPAGPPGPGAEVVQ